MKTVVLAFAILAFAIAPPREATAQMSIASAPIIAGESFSIPSSTYGDEREINVWTPPDYVHGTDRYTVLYLLDGGREQDFPHIAGLAQLASLGQTFGPLIVVGIKSQARRHELTPPPASARFAREFPDAGGDAQFRSFLQNEVIPFVEARYRAGARRVLMGESLAGLFVVDTFLRQPALFNDYVAVSPSLWWDDQAPSNSAARILAGRPRSDVRLYLAIANEGDATQSGMDTLLRALRGAPAGVVTWRYSDRRQSETHATILHPAALDALRWLYPRAEPNYGPSPWYYLNPRDRRN
jgi:predicted alpha/beta superfamily hydrolase